MFVGSDIFDVKSRDQYSSFEFNEQLACGVAVHAREWPGSEVAARFLVEAAKISGVWELMEYGSHENFRTKRTKLIKAKTVERIARGAMPNAADAFAVTLHGDQPMLTKDKRLAQYGGHCAAIRRLRQPTVYPWGRSWLGLGTLKADFVFPFDASSFEAAKAILSCAMHMFGAAYGYVFVHDVYCYPQWYARGMGNTPVYGAFGFRIAHEIPGWFWGCDDLIWSQADPVFRDLFAINLVSRAHLASSLRDGEALGDWIRSGSDRGRLDAIGRGRWLWSLTDLELFHARAVLAEAGLLFSNLGRVYRDLSPAYSSERATQFN